MLFLGGVTQISLIVDPRRTARFHLAKTILYQREVQLL